MIKKRKPKRKMETVRNTSARLKQKTVTSYGPIKIKKLKPVEGAELKQPCGESSKNHAQSNYKFESNRNYFTICVYAIVTIAIAGLLIYSIINLPSIKSALRGFLTVISPFITAFFIAFIINPLVRIIESRFFLNICKIQSVKIRLLLSIFVSYIAILGLLIIGFRYVIPQIMESITDLTLRLPEMYQEVILFLNNIEKYLSPELIQFIENKLGEITPQLVSLGSDLVKNVFPVIIDVPVYLAKLAINILLSIAISIYMLYDKRILSKHSTRAIYAVIPKKKAESVIKITKDCSLIFSSFVVGKSIDSLIIGIICFVAMLILKLPYAVLISVIVGVTNMIPYFGPFIGAVPGVLLYLCIDPLKAIIFVLMIFVLQQFDGWILGPKILGESTGLTPLWVIFGITVGGAYGGVLGMFLGVPIVAVLAYLANLFITVKLKEKNLEII